MRTCNLRLRWLLAQVDFRSCGAPAMSPLVSQARGSSSLPICKIPIAVQWRISTNENYLLILLPDHFSLGSANDFNDLVMSLVHFVHFRGVFGE
jgi:hypothetical protein